MTLATYINDLLYRYDCVIVPGFGGFVTNKIGAKMDDNTQTFNPPKKQITFNSYLQHNDGLLANYIASSKKISFEEATKFITEGVAVWKKTLETDAITIALIGSLSLNEEKQLIFEPNAKSNFLTASFGLASVETSEVERTETIVKELPVVTKNNTIPLLYKGAAAAAVFIGLAYVGWTGFNADAQQNLVANQEQVLEKKIQSATFVIDNPLPSINLNVAKENSGNIHIIAGAFQEVENAQKKLAELQALGYKASIIGKNKFDLIQVAFASFTHNEEARKELSLIKQTVNQDAWILVK